MSGETGNGMARWRVGVDSGGTFTDICLFDEQAGRVETWKVPSTPDDPSRGIAEGVEEGMRRVAPEAGDRPAAPIVYFGHGTTVATNALIQHRGVKTGLVTTDGFRDLLEIGRQKRPDLYDIQADKPTTLVPRDLRLEVPERLRHTGEVDTPLDEDRMRAAARTLKAAGVKAVAVSFLYGFIRPDHEKRAVAILREEMPDAFISAGHEIAPEFREFERLSTVVLNAYLGPVMGSYIRRLSPRLEALGMTATPHLTQSNGGVIGFSTAADMPVRTILSGPSTGVVGAQAIGAAAGFADLITFDMGGTSTDVALLQDGRCGLAAEATVHGYPIKAPMLDIHTVGRRRRLDRLYRQRRPPEGGAALRRRRSRPGLLRPRQRGARRHRRQRGAADAQPRAPAGRPHEDPAAISPYGRWDAWPSGWASASRKRRRASCRSSPPTWRARSASSPCSAATIRATTR